MTRRILALLIIIWILGFAWFALFLPQPMDIEQTDGVVVLTGGTNRIDRGLVIMRAGKARRLLISGVDRDVRPAELAAQYPGKEDIFACCTDLGFRAVDTQSNALETARWVEKHHIKSVRLVTNAWHMRRARLELDNAMSGKVKITNDAVPASPSLAILFTEYNKYWLRKLAATLGL
jgi:uncharacterized SAM-binding protein YcdF (DUF218 family)